MAIHNQLPIYKVAYSLLLSATTLTKNMPRDFKASVGAEVRDVCVQMMLLIMRANIAENKRPYLDVLLEHVEMAQLLIRICKDMRFISLPQYSETVELIDRVGRQTNGWRKSLPKASPPPAA